MASLISPLNRLGPAALLRPEACGQAAACASCLHACTQACIPLPRCPLRRGCPRVARLLRQRILFCFVNATAYVLCSPTLRASQMAVADALHLAAMVRSQSGANKRPATNPAASSAAILPVRSQAPPAGFPQVAVAGLGAVSGCQPSTGPDVAAMMVAGRQCMPPASEGTPVTTSSNEQPHNASLALQSSMPVQMAAAGMAQFAAGMAQCNQTPLQPGCAPVAVNSGGMVTQMQPAQMQPGQMQPAQMQLGQMQPAQMQPGQFPSAQIQATGRQMMPMQMGPVPVVGQFGQMQPMTAAQMAAQMGNKQPGTGAPPVAPQVGSGMTIQPTMQCMPTMNGMVPQCVMCGPGGTPTCNGCCAGATGCCAGAAGCCAGGGGCCAGGGGGCCPVQMQAPMQLGVPTGPSMGVSTTQGMTQGGVSPRCAAVGPGKEAGGVSAAMVAAGGGGSGQLGGQLIPSPMMQQMPSFAGPAGMTVPPGMMPVFQMPGMPGMQGMQAMQAMQGMQGMQGMPGMPMACPPGCQPGCGMGGAMPPPSALSLPGGSGAGGSGGAGPSSLGASSSGGGGGGGGQIADPNEHRKVRHNLAERRRTNRINKLFNQLYEVLISPEVLPLLNEPGPNGEVRKLPRKSKAAVLEAAIHCIETLQRRAAEANARARAQAVQAAGAAACAAAAATGIATNADQAAISANGAGDARPTVTATAAGGAPAAAAAAAPAAAPATAPATAASNAANIQALLATDPMSAAQPQGAPMMMAGGAPMMMMPGGQPMMMMPGGQPMMMPGGQPMMMGGGMAAGGMAGGAQPGMPTGNFVGMMQMQMPNGQFAQVPVMQLPNGQMMPMMQWPQQPQMQPQMQPQAVAPAPAAAAPASCSGKAKATVVSAVPAPMGSAGPAGSSSPHSSDTDQTGTDQTAHVQHQISQASTQASAAPTARASALAAEAPSAAVPRGKGKGKAPMPQGDDEAMDSDEDDDELDDEEDDDGLGDDDEEEDDDGDDDL